ncbi:MAG: glycosyltransferase family 2 protein [Nitrospiraceae bacterium]
MNERNTNTCRRVEAERPSISVIVPVYNGGEKFRQCLSSLMKLDPPPAEIIVVADGDTDGSSQLAAEVGLRVVKFQSPGGPARARNLGARHATGTILFFIDADVTVPQDAIRLVATAFAQAPEAAAVFGSYDDEPGERNFLSQYRNLLHHYVHQQGLEEASTFWGACGAIRREVFMTIGGFDETYRHPSVEDIELGYRLKRAGHTIRLCKSIQIKHWKRWEVRSMLKADFFYRALPWTALILQHRRLANDLNLRVSERLSVALAYGLLVTLAVSAWRPIVITAAGVFAVALLALNAGLYGFLRRKRGLGFTVLAVPWHWLYFLYGGLAFAVGIAGQLLGHDTAPRRRPQSLHVSGVTWGTRSPADE